MNFPFRSKPDGLRSDTLRSVVIHVVLWTLIILIFAPRAVPWAKTLLAFEKKHVAQVAPKKTPKENGPATKETLAASMVESQLSQMVAGELTQKDEQNLLEKTHDDLAETASKMEASASPDADLGKLSEEMKKDAYADLDSEIKNMAHDAMTDEVDSQLNAGIYDQVKNKIESGAMDQMSAELSNKIKDELAKERQARTDKAIAGLEQVKKQLTTARDAADQAANQARNSQFDPAAASEKQTSDLTAAADKAATDSLAQTVKSFPQTAAQADQAGNAFKNDAQDALQGAAQAIAAKKKDDASAQMGKVDDALNKRIAALSQLQDQVRQAAGAPVDPLSQAMLAGSMADLQKEIADELQKQSLDALSSKIVDHMTQALQAEAAKLGLTVDQLRALIEAEVKNRLAANFKDHPPVTDAALNQTRADNQLQTPEELEKAREAADEALKALTDARTAEASVAVTDAAQTADTVDQQQQQAAQKYDSAHDALEKARDLARESSVANQGKVFNIGDSDRRSEADAKMGVIPDLVRADQRPSADALKTQVVQSLDERIAQVQDLRDSLGHEKDALAAAQKAPVAATVDPGAMAAMKSALHADVAQIAGNHLPQIMAAAGDVEASDAQSTDLRMDGIAGLLGKVNQMEANMADGRPGLGLEGLGMGAGGGMMPGLGKPHGMSRFEAINEAAMEKFGKDLRNRSDPDNFYKPASDADGIASVAHPVDPTDLPAEVYFDPAQTAPPAPAPAGPAPERTVPNPTFKTVAFGAAAMMDQPINVDGDLSDWGELKHPMPTRFRSDGQPVTDPTNVYVRWSPDGLYIGYTTKKVGPIIPDAHLGDCMEVWIDGQNTRSKQMSESQTSQQLFLAPFGYQGNPAPAIVEVGRGNRGLKMFASYVDRAGALGKVAAKMVPGGYSVEAFLSRKAIAYPNLIPGAYLAFNFSVNRGATDLDCEQWSAPKSQVTWDKPDTWGDLLLLGSDAKARFISYADPTKPAEPLVPGQPLAFEIQDKDMDLNPHEKDRVPAVLKLQGADEGLFVVLEETSDNSGIFRGSVNTQAYGATPKPDTLNIRGGESVELIYNDLRTEYGESNRVVTATLPVGTPVLRLAGHP